MLLLKLLYIFTGPMGIYVTAINSYDPLNECQCSVIVCVCLCVRVCTCVLETSLKIHDPLKSLATS